MRLLVFQSLSFIGLKSKMHSYVKDTGKNEKTAKGIRKYLIKKNIAHKDYKDTLQNNKQIYHTMKTVRSVCHQLGSYELRKISSLMVKLVMHMATTK